MHNVNSILSAHNRCILNPSKTNYGCNGRDNTNCSLQNQCLTPNTVYQDVSNKVDDETIKHRSKRYVAILQKMTNMKNIAMQVNPRNIYGN